MNIYLIQRDDWDYDEVDSAVIVANNSKEVREMFGYTNIEFCKKISDYTGKKKRPYHVLESFNAG